MTSSHGVTFQLPPLLRSRLPRVQKAHTRRRSLSLGRRRSTQAFCARTAPRWLQFAQGLILLFGAWPWYGVSVTASNAGCRVRSKRTHAGPSCLSGGGRLRPYR